MHIKTKRMHNDENTYRRRKHTERRNMFRNTKTCTERQNTHRRRKTHRKTNHAQRIENTYIKMKHIKIGKYTQKEQKHQAVETGLYKFAVLTSSTAGNNKGGQS